MRIGIFSDTYKPNVNGIVTSIETVKMGLEAAGAEVFVFAPNQYLRYKKLAAEKIWLLPAIRFWGEKRYNVALPFSGFGDIAKTKLDVVHTQTPFSMGIVGLKIAGRKHLPLVYTHHTRYQEYVHYLKLRGELLRFVTGAGMKQIVGFINKHDAVIAPSSGIKRELENFGVKKSISVIPTGINILETIRLSKKSDPGSVLKKFGIGSGDEFLVFTSRLGKEKNIEFIIRVMRRIVAKRPAVKLLVIGDGNAAGDLKNMVKKLGLEKNIIFTGFMKHEEIFPVYRRAKLFVFSSFTETQGLVILEAAALGVPIVALGTIGIEDVLKNDNGGFLVENSEELFAKRVLSLLEDDALREKKSAEAELTAKSFSIEATTAKLLHLYQNIITSKQPQPQNSTEPDRRGEHQDR